MPVRSQFETEAEFVEHLRMWFAGQALPGIAFDCGTSKEEAAETAYEFADAMLAERAKAGTP